MRGKDELGEKIKHRKIGKSNDYLKKKCYPVIVISL